MQAQRGDSVSVAPFAGKGESNSYLRIMDHVDGFSRDTETIYIALTL